MSASSRSSAYGVRTHVCIPLSVRGRALGVLGLIDRQRHTFDAEDLALFNSAGEQLGVAIERANLFEEAWQRVKLEERARLAREIHDSLAQALTGIVIQLEDAEGVVASRPERARAEIKSACALARQSLEEARRSVWELQPLALASGGIIAAITRELRALEAKGLETALECPAEAPEWLAGVQDATSAVRVTRAPAACGRTRSPGPGCPARRRFPCGETYAGRRDPHPLELRIPIREFRPGRRLGCDVRARGPSPRAFGARSGWRRGLAVSHSAMVDLGMDPARLAVM